MTSLQQELQTVAVAAPQHFRNLTLFPLTRTKTGEWPPYVLADEAMQKGLARVTEVAGGSVPELQFENRCELPVLLLDGEELVGAKQNRAVNLTILAPARATIVIPVSCVEAGRWHMASAEFRPAYHMMYAAGRAARVRQVTASLRVSGTRRSDQGAVWDDIAAKAVRMDAMSPTQAMSAVFERHANSVEEYVRAFTCIDGQAGVVFTTGAAFGLDLFDRADTMRQVFPKLVRSYALDAIEGAARTPGARDRGGPRFPRGLRVRDGGQRTSHGPWKGRPPERREGCGCCPLGRRPLCSHLRVFRRRARRRRAANPVQPAVASPPAAHGVLTVCLRGLVKCAFRLVDRGKRTDLMGV